MDFSVLGLVWYLFIKVVLFQTNIIQLQLRMLKYCHFVVVKTVLLCLPPFFFFFLDQSEARAVVHLE